MKTLYLLRHAKAGKSNKKILDDHDRPLTDKGIEACDTLREYAKKNKVNPNIILCSTARRTKKTAELVFDKIESRKTMHVSKLYLASAGEILSVVADISDDNKSAIVVGHNPGLHDLALYLVKDGDISLIRKLRDSFSTGTLAEFTLNIKSWKDLSRKIGILENLVIPKEID